MNQFKTTSLKFKYSIFKVLMYSSLIFAVFFLIGYPVVNMFYPSQAHTAADFPIFLTIAMALAIMTHAECRNLEDKIKETSNESFNG